MEASRVILETAAEAFLIADAITSRSRSTVSIACIDRLYLNGYVPRLQLLSDN